MLDVAELCLLAFWLLSDAKKNCGCSCARDLAVRNGKPADKLWMNLQLCNFMRSISKLGSGSAGFSCIRFRLSLLASWVCMEWVKSTFGHAREEKRSILLKKSGRLKKISYSYIHSNRMCQP